MRRKLLQLRLLASAFAIATLAQATPESSAEPGARAAHHEPKSILSRKLLFATASPYNNPSPACQIGCPGNACSCPVSPSQVLSPTSTPSIPAPPHGPGTPQASTPPSQVSPTSPTVVDFILIFAAVPSDSSPNFIAELTLGIQHAINLFSLPLSVAVQAIQVLTLDPTQPLRMRVISTFLPANVVPLAPAKGSSMALMVALNPEMLFTPATMLRDYGAVQSTTVKLNAAPIAGLRPPPPAPPPPTPYKQKNMTALYGGIGGGVAALLLIVCGTICYFKASNDRRVELEETQRELQEERQRAEGKARFAATGGRVDLSAYTGGQPDEAGGSNEFEMATRGAQIDNGTASMSAAEAGASPWRWGYQMKRISSTARAGFSRHPSGDNVPSSGQIASELPEMFEPNPLYRGGAGRDPSMFAGGGEDSTKFAGANVFVEPQHAAPEHPASDDAAEVRYPSIH